jgi:hypothetical protein
MEIMFKKRGRAVIVGLAVPATLAAGGMAVAASNHPARPAWVNDRGVGQIDKMPAKVPMVDHAGRLVRDAHGNLTMHRTDVSPPPRNRQG